MHVLVCSKKSLYEVYQHSILSKYHLNKIVVNHKEHTQTQEVIFSVLKKLKIPYKSVYRDDLSRLKRIDHYDLIISCGGDGTLLHVQRFIRKGKIFAVNSDPKNSVGYFSIAHRFTFLKQLTKYLDGELSEVSINRLMLKINKKIYTKRIFNDVLISNETPSLTSRYEITVNNKKEVQKSSGIWITTAAGSTGAIKSAGGNALPANSKKFEFLVREPDYTFNSRLINKIMKPEESIIIDSRMINGICYIDGAADSVRFNLGDRLTFSNSSEPITLIR